MSETTLLAKVTKQQKTASVWQRRCATQVQVVSMCGALDLYHSDPYTILLLSPCTLWKVKSSIEMEICLTQECFLSVNGTFYDPCECMPEICSPNQDNTIQIAFTFSCQSFPPTGKSCSISLDPRKVVRKMEMGWWGDDTLLGRQHNTWLASPSNLLDIDTLVSRFWTTAHGSETQPMVTTGLLLRG